MDTIKILLSLTVALLLGALAMSWKGFRQEQQETPKDELAEVQRQIDQIRVERERLKLERERLLLGEVAGRSAPAAPAAAMASPSPAPAVPPMEVIPEVAAPPAALPPPPVDAAADPVAPAPAGSEERAKKIAAAPAVAKIAEWVDSPELGSFATIEVKDASLKAGELICVRRNSGILGRLKVSEVTAEGGIANAMGQFPGIKPQAGDELIREP